MNKLCGMTVYVNESLYREAPVRVHKSGVGRRNGYHKRVQKKWNKRYGIKREPYHIVTPAGIFMPTELFVKLSLMLEVDKLQEKEVLYGKKVTGVVFDDL